MASFLSPHLSKPKPLLPLPLIRATSSSFSTNAAAVTAQSPPVPSLQSLEEAFGRQGIKFTETNGISSVELSVRNGSSVNLRLSDALITSYKPKVFWKDDGCRELLRTIQTSEDPSSVKGGIGLVLNDLSKLAKNNSPWSPSEWVLKEADSDSFDAVQVELGCTNGNGTLEVTYVISLYPLSLATAVIVKNTGSKPIELTSAILSHINFDSRDRTAIEGLLGCSYCAHPPPASSFGILSPAEAMRPDDSGWFGSSDAPKTGVWTVEDEKFTMLKGKFSRLYAAPPSERSKEVYRTVPSNYTTIDKGSKLSFRIIRMGYDDIYLGTPGSFAKQYSDKDYFICTGPASMLVPVVLNPEEEWRAAQVIEHDNL
ncbi:hypothetical protein LUZ63_018757 [Rhynchospora breviuscula]|uniref:Photosynthetic NDH subcomplex B 2 n=1 Tax=Rhynchospora breviuscula TaxID=2022672 RepID=A0A9Q0C508_9POAL|nr:hypothetical protein LUZ63_018757 [Rhynchospora breviuscula]